MANDNFLKDFEQDIIYFLNMCTEDDAKLFIANPKNKKIEDFGRFICLGLAFNMRGVFLNIFSQYEKVADVDNIFSFMDTVSFEQAKNWVEEFLDKIDKPTLKMCAKSIWEKKKKYFETHDFKLSELLYH